MSKDKQLRAFVQKQKLLISQAESEAERAIAYGLWAGFVTGLLRTKSISQKEYDELYAEIVAYQERIA